MEKITRLRNPHTGEVRAINIRLTFFQILPALRSWFVHLFLLGRPLLGLTGIALIIVAIVFGVEVEGGKPVAVIAAFAYFALGIYFVLNRYKIQIDHMIKNGWVVEDEIKDK